MLYNHLAQRAIEQAEKGNYSEVTNLVEKLRHPYDGNDRDVPELEKPNELTKGNEMAKTTTDPTEKCYTGAYLKSTIYESRSSGTGTRLRVT
ncbi:unnamed protein product [Didymodactylos carnosus]|uniref:Uncharacterized protein n=1 Tax=Didymodactylos carnosus TaxID=1234261 RepID=A0A8S2J320_9BILA|nr:unnamed protein product [Didymodactylos carnosus]CAF3784791.1 unnamed protein product [Didymodactylos carnosus]